MGRAKISTEMHLCAQERETVPKLVPLSALTGAVHYLHQQECDIYACLLARGRNKTSLSMVQIPLQGDCHTQSTFICFAELWALKKIITSGSKLVLVKSNN